MITGVEVIRSAKRPKGTPQILVVDAPHVWINHHLRCQRHTSNRHSQSDHKL